MFFIIPIGVSYQARRYPVITFTLMGLNTLIYIIGLIHGWDNEEIQHWWLHTFGLIPAKSTWYTYFTAMFMHAGFFHLLGNMIYLFLFGSCVEDLINRWRYLIFYILGGLLANLAYVLLIPNHLESTIPMVGASGAISACMGGFVLLLHKVKIEFKWGVYFFFRFLSGEFRLPAWLVLSFWFLQDLAGAAIGMALENVGGGTAFGAHVGGFVCGLLMILALKPILRRETREEEEREERENAAEIEDETEPVNDGIEIYLMNDGTQLGPLTSSQVRQMIRLGSVSKEAEFWHDGMEDWVNITKFGK